MPMLSAAWTTASRMATPLPWELPHGRDQHRVTDHRNAGQGHEAHAGGDAERHVSTGRSPSGAAPPPG